MPAVTTFRTPRRQRTRGRRLRGVVLGLALAAACRGGGDGVALVAPFNEHTELGEVTATWANTGVARAFARGARLKKPEVKFQYRASVENALRHKLFVRLADFRLVDDAGRELASDSVRVECTMGAGQAEGVLAGELWVPREAAAAVRGYRVTHFAVPLSDRGRGLYREWRLRGQGGRESEVDAEIAAYASAPPCATR